MAIPKKDLGSQLTEDLNRVFTEDLNRVFQEEYNNMATNNRATRPLRTYDVNTDTYRSGIETWHARGAEHHLVKQLEERLERMETVHRQEMRNLVSQVISMNNAVDARVQHINGFYTWLIETYPETVAQYKALLNLKRLNEEGEE
jgi:DNA-directed RNA polymerase